MQEIENKVHHCQVRTTMKLALAAMLTLLLNACSEGSSDEPEVDGLRFTNTTINAYFVNTGVIPLRGINARGYMGLSNLRSGVSCYSAGMTSNSPYPCYEVNDVNGYRARYIVAEPLSSSSVYNEEKDSPVVNRSRVVSDMDFGQFNLGRIIYNPAWIRGYGVEIIPASAISIQIDASEFSPMNKQRNFNNEYNWNYRITTGNLKGEGLRFVNGRLTQISLVSDIWVDAYMGGNNQGRFLWYTPSRSLFQGNALRISNSSLRFVFDQTQNAVVPNMGTQNMRVTITRSGAISDY